MFDPLIYAMKGCTVIALMSSRARKTLTDMIHLKPDKVQNMHHARHVRRRHMKTHTDHAYLITCEADHAYTEFYYRTQDAYKACTAGTVEQAHSHGASGGALR